MPFVVIVSSKEAKSGVEGNPVITRDGERFVVLVEPGGWVEATSCRYNQGDVLPPDAKTFKTLASAKQFARRWKGHPWWVVPDGNFEIIQVKRITRTRKYTHGFRSLAVSYSKPE